MLISYCVVNTNGRDLLLAGLEAIERTAPVGVEREVIVLDNASDDGSADAVRALGRDYRLIELHERTGKAENDSTLMRESRGRYSLLLNEDAELQPGAVEALLEALESDPRAGAAGAQLLDADGTPVPCAWRLPGLGTALAQALFLHKQLVTESGGSETREVGWVQSSAMLVRGEAAEQVGWMDPGFFVYSDETDFAKRLHDAGWRILHVPGARAIHHDQLATDLEGQRRRIVEFHRNRDLYIRKHHSMPVVAATRVLYALPYLVRATAALVLPGHDPQRYLMHARQALQPGRGQGIREAAEQRNRRVSEAA
ncbi:MAG: glycosyltransferase family 2 protein [Thermoleophilaceae bacterium]